MICSTLIIKKDSSHKGYSLQALCGIVWERALSAQSELLLAQKA
jgi:hypothetical protein